MKAMALTRQGLGHVESVEAGMPVPGPTEVLVRVLACGVYRTDLHLVDGDARKSTTAVWSWVITARLARTRLTEPQIVARVRAHYQIAR